MIPFYIFLFCLFATYATYLLLTRKSAAQREQFERRLTEVMTYARSPEDVRIKLSKDDLLSEIPQLNELLRQLPFAVSLKRMIEQADLQLTVMRLLMFSGLAGMMACMAISMISISFILALCVGLLASAVPLLHVLWKRKKRLDKFLKDLPDALDLMSRALAAGHAFTEAVQMVSTEMPEPVATEFRRTYEEQNLGLSLKFALDNLYLRIPLMDLRLCITAILIQRETGGNLAEILERVAHTVRERFRILEDLNTLTMQSRLSAWILCGIPIFIALMATVLNPDYMSVLWKDPRGNKLIALAMTLQVTGMLIVRKIINIKI